MDVKELGRLIGAKSGKAEYLPVAFLLKTGYASFGHYNSALNEGLNDLCVLLNVRLIDLSQSTQKAKTPIRDFTDFLEDVVTRAARKEEEQEDSDDLPDKSKFGRAMPIAAIVVDEIAIVYPVAQIGTLVRRSREKAQTPPASPSASSRAKVQAPAPAASSTSSLLDIDKSEILGVLRMKLW
jgi:hypothetical protein